MTMAERNNKLKHLITCLKCEVRGKSCDVNCPTQYDAGNMGEIIENLEVISKALEQEPSGDLISRQAVYHILDEVGGDFDKPREAVVPVDYIADMVGELPSVNPQEPKTGHWTTVEMTQDGCRYTVTYCSECDEDVDYRTDYCPNCGARMVEPQESEDKE